MFGAGLPACAMKFNCVGELVKDGENGLVFETKEELAEDMYRLLHSFPEASELERLQKGVSPFQRLRWSENWKENAKFVILFRFCWTRLTP